MNTNFEAIGLTLLGMKPESAAPEADVLNTRPSELLLTRKGMEESVYFGRKLYKRASSSGVLRCTLKVVIVLVLLLYDVSCVPLCENFYVRFREIITILFHLLVVFITL